MICQECNQRPATLHFTNFINGEKTEMHLCEKCAQEKGELFMLNSASGFSLSNFLGGLLNIDPAFQQPQKEAFHQQSILQCERCSMTFPQFIKAGRFGCSHCYETFNDQLNSVLRRLHGGNWSHSGKIPKRIGGNLHVRKNLETLKNQLQQLISHEEFEKAAEVRDQIRSLEKKINQGHEGGK